VTGYGIAELKDMLWRAITDENNRIDAPDLIHRPLDGHHRVSEEDNFIFEYTPTSDEAEQEAEDLRSISPDAWGEDVDWDDADYEDEYDDERPGDDDDDEDERHSDDDIFGYEAINDYRR